MHVRIAFFLAIFFISFCAGGCAAISTGGFTSKDPGKVFVPSAYHVGRTVPVVHFEGRNDVSGYSTRDFSFTSQFPSGYEKNDRIRGTIYSPAFPKTSDVFIILPGSHEDASAKKLGKIFVKLGYAVITIHSGFTPLPRSIFKEASVKKTPEEAVGLATGYFVQAMTAHTIDLMRLEDYLLAHSPEFGNPRAFHMVGVSLGGISASLLAGIDSRVKSLLTIVSSGSVARILMDTKNPDIRKIREVLMKKFGLNYEEAYALIARKIGDAEPLTYARRLDPSCVVMVSGQLDMWGIPVDSAIPLTATTETWEAYGRPEWIRMYTGHASSFLAFLPGWLELSRMQHLPWTLTESYARHIVRVHYLPKALRGGE